MKNKISRKKLVVFGLILIAFLGVSFIVYKVATASVSDAVISRIEMTSIETGSNLDSEDNLVTTCDNDGKNCVNTYTASKDSSKDNILVKTFDKIKYTFNFDVMDSSDSFNDVENVNVKLRIVLNGDDNKYVSFDNNCDEVGVCIIKNCSSFESNKYSVELNVNNAPNGYEIHPSFIFDVEENTNDDEIKLGFNEASTKNYFYSYNNNNYSNVGPANYMPTIVSSSAANSSYVLYPSTNENFTQSAKYNGQNGRFITYLLGIKFNGVSGSYYDSNEITFNISFNQDGNETPIVNDNWIRLYGSEIVDGIRPISYNLPYSTVYNDPSKYIKNPGSLSIAKNGDIYTVEIKDFNLLLNSPTLNSNGTPVDGMYIATLALTNFSPRTEVDGNNIINNTITVTDLNNNLIGTATIQNTFEQVASISQNENNDTVDYLTSSAFYDDDERVQLSTRDGGAGSVSKGTMVKYITKFKNNKTSSNQGLKEVIKLDTYAYRVISYNDEKDIDIRIKCGKKDCSGISKDDFEIKYLSGTFDNVNYSLNSEFDQRLSNNDRGVVNGCSSINLASLNKDQVMNLYGGPCIKGISESNFTNISDAYVSTENENTEIPISKIIVQTKQGITIPDNAEVIVIVRARVRDVTDLTHNYQATTMISTSDYDEVLKYFAPQINDAISPDNYIKTTYSGNTIIDNDNYIGDSLKIVNYTLRQNITVTNKNNDGTVKTKYRTTDNETITYKVETSVNDNNMNSGADDTWYIKTIYVNVFIPNTLVYIPDDSLIEPIEVSTDSNGTTLRYQVVKPSDKMKPNMKIKDVTFKTKLVPTLQGRSTPIVVSSYPEGINVNNEVDTSLWSSKNAEFTIYGTGINEVIGTQSIGTSGSLIEKNGTIDYILNAYNNVGDDVDDYSLIDILPFSGDENGSTFTGSYSVKVNSNLVSLDSIKCTKVNPLNITRNNDVIWEDCGNIANDFIDGITAIKVENISITNNSYMGEIYVSLKTKDNKSSDRYVNRFTGYTRETSDNISNAISASVVNRTISGTAFLDNSGTGVKDGTETPISDIPVTLYKVTNDGELQKVSETVTNDKGYYVFNNLSKGRYKIRAKYDITKYDLALRYATEDTTKDSDAYQIDDEGLIEISDKTETSKGIVLYPPTNNVSNMDIGLLIKQTFGFTMSKYITKVDLNYNGITDTKTYNNESKILINVKNSLKATAKVYYGIAITNNSNKAGYINLVKEDIPEGFIFDKNYPENEGWFETDNMLGNRTLENIVVYPNDTVYLQIVLFMPRREEAGTFINTAAVAEISEYKPIETIINDQEYVNDDQYVVGDKLRYAGVNFHVIEAIPNGNEQILTLLADANQTNKKHLEHTSDVYKWSKSNINKYLNDEWLSVHNINPSSLINFNICDDASGLFNTDANGGVVEADTCASNQYTTSKVRLLTQREFNNLVNNLTDSSFLFTDNYWLMDSVYSTKTDDTYNDFGVLNDDYNTSNLVKYVDASNSSVLPVQGNNGFSKTVNATSVLMVRPVIKISTKNIILE